MALIYEVKGWMTPRPAGSDNYDPVKTRRARLDTLFSQSSPTVVSPIHGHFLMPSQVNTQHKVQQCEFFDKYLICQETNTPMR